MKLSISLIKFLICIKVIMHIFKHIKIKYFKMKMKIIRIEVSVKTKYKILIIKIIILINKTIQNSIYLVLHKIIINMEILLKNNLYKIVKKYSKIFKIKILCFKTRPSKIRLICKIIHSNWFKIILITILKTNNKLNLLTGI
jgi:hypothetical protein